MSEEIAHNPGEVDFKVVKLVCVRCKHEWVPRVEHVYVCPNCKDPRWRMPKK